MSNQNGVVFLSGRMTNLRPFGVADVPQLAKWINDPEIRQFISNSFPTSFKSEEDWVLGLGKDKNNVVLGIETKDGQLIGSMGLHGIDWINRVATSGAFIGLKEYWGKGFGSDAKMALLDYAFNTLNLRRVNSDVLEFNERSANYSLKCGYQIEGKRRQALYRNGRYWDRIELGVLREDWLPIWEKYRETGLFK